MPRFVGRAVLSEINTLAGQSVAIVRCCEVLSRTFWNDARRIDHAVAGVVMTFDVSEIYRRGDTRPLVKLA